MQERILGCLMGAAIGDALGMPFEEMSLSVREELYGRERVTDFWPGKPYKNRQQYVEAGSVTDDTEMTLATAESIINYGAVVTKGIGDNLLCWYNRQLPWLQGSPEMRNIGPTTGEALKRYAKGMSCKKSGQSGNGCGAAIRIAPVALCCFNDFEMLRRAVLSVSQITHRNPRKPLAEEGALCVAASIRHLVNGGVPKDLLDELLQIVQTQDFKVKLRRIQDGLSEWTGNEAGENLGTGGDSYLATEVVSLALFIFLKYGNDFSEAVIEAVNITSGSGVDSDSIASIAGALSGCYLGVDAIPLHFRQRVEYAETIESLANSLSELASLKNGRVRFKEE